MYYERERMKFMLKRIVNKLKHLCIIIDDPEVKFDMLRNTYLSELDELQKIYAYNMNSVSYRNKLDTLRDAYKLEFEFLLDNIYGKAC